MRALTLFAGSLALLGACQSSPSGETIAPEQIAFFDNLSALCGQSYAGALVSQDAVDDELRGQAMAMHVRDCSDTEIKIPFHVGENRSRTWIISKTDTGLRLKHQHLHEDGKPDDVTFYGGDTDQSGSATRQDFPVDDFSIAMFNENGLTASVTNVWTVDIRHDDIFAYQLSRKGRLFRVEFDLTEEIETPPPAWGHTP